MLLNTKTEWLWQDGIWCQTSNLDGSAKYAAQVSKCNPFLDNPKLVIVLYQSSEQRHCQFWRCEMHKIDGNPNPIDHCVFWQVGTDIKIFSSTPDTRFVIEAPSLEIAKLKAPSIIKNSLEHIRDQHLVMYQKLIDDLFIADQICT